MKPDCKSSAVLEILTFDGVMIDFETLNESFFSVGISNWVSAFALILIDFFFIFLCFT